MDGSEALERPRPGASAQREYEELRTRERQRRRAHLIRTVVLMLVLPAAAAAGVLYGCSRLNEALATTIDPTPIDPGVAHLLAGLIAAAVLTIIAAESWGSSDTAEALRLEAAGERSTAAVLGKLAAQGWVTLHDRRFPRSSWNIDHVAIGPTGIAVIESRNWTGRVVVTPRRLRRNGKRVEGLTGQVGDTVAAIELLLGESVVPIPVFGIICIHGAHVEHRRGVVGFIRRRPPTPGGVQVCSRRRLRKVLRERPTADGIDVDKVASFLDQALRAAE